MFRKEGGVWQQDIEDNKYLATILRAVQTAQLARDEKKLAPKDAVISQQTQKVTTQISAVGALKSALSTFQDSLAAIDTPTAFNAAIANTTNGSVFTATADADAIAGSYTITVGQLASAQQLVSKPFGGAGGVTLGTGTLQLSLGASSFSVAVDSTNNTVGGLAAAINSGPTPSPARQATVFTFTLQTS